MYCVSTWKRRALLVLTLLMAVVTISCGSGKKETIAVYKDGELQKEYDIDARGWESGEDFVYLNLEHGAYIYSWQGESRIDYREKKGILIVNKKTVGADLRHLKAEDLEDPSTIITVKVDADHIDELKNLPNLVAVKVFDANNATLGKLTELTNLKALDLGDNRSRTYSPGKLHDLKTLENLKWLRLRAVKGLTPFNPTFLKELRGLRFLSFTDQIISTGGLASLAGLTNLRVLILDGCYIGLTDAGLSHLGKLSNLRMLILRSTAPGHKGSGGLETLSELSELRVLDISSNSEIDAGLEYLSELTNLQELNLSLSNASGFGLQHLYSLKNLRKLNLTYTEVSENDITEFKKALPKCEIIR